MVKRFHIKEIVAVFAHTGFLAMGYFSWRGEPVLGYLLSTPHFLVYGFPTDKYWAQAFKVEEAVSSVLSPSRDIMRDHIAAYARGGESGFGTHPNELDVFNVPDARDQENIINVVRQCIRRDHMIAMRIDFYEEQPLPDGRKAGGARKLTRSVVVQ
jgi:hypothetical protein